MSFEITAFFLDQDIFDVKFNATSKIMQKYDIPCNFAFVKCSDFGLKAIQCPEAG